MFPSPENIRDAIELLTNSKRPLIIVGKGAAYARAENEIRKLISSTHLPFLATPMGKGVVSDESLEFVGSARTFALQKADVILLLGARLNWILHFGRPPRFDPYVKVIQVYLKLINIFFHLMILVTIAICQHTFYYCEII